MAPLGMFLFFPTSVSQFLIKSAYPLGFVFALDVEIEGERIKFSKQLIQHCWMVVHRATLPTPAKSRYMYAMKTKTDVFLDNYYITNCWFL